MKTLNILFAITTGITLATLSGCRKEERESRMTVKMVDAPGDFQEVNVEVLKVQVNHSGAGWIDLPTNVGIYDLLTLQNDVSATLVDSGVLPSGHLNQFRLILGDDNTVKVDDIYYPLSTPSAQQSGLKINLNSDFEPNVYYQLILDFDAANSIVTQGNGGYSLKPVIKVLSIQPL